MKLLKYKLPKIFSNYKKPDEILYNSRKFILDCNLHFSKNLKKKILPTILSSYNSSISKSKSFCLVTGRRRYTIKYTQTSRHIFFERCREGFFTGFHYK